VTKDYIFPTTPTHRQQIRIRSSTGRLRLWLAVIHSAERSFHTNRFLGKTSHKRGHMNYVKNPGRFVGLLYVLVSVPGAFALIYVPSKLIVRGNATATASNIVASETLFRAGIACNLLSEIFFMWVALALYDLLKGVNQRRAALMLGLIVVSIPITLLNELNAIAALILVRGSDFLTVVEKPQRDALAMLFLDLHNHGFSIAEIFWGLWLFPLGLLVYRSGFFPRILGVLLMLRCLGYVVESFTFFLLPYYVDIVSRWMRPLRFGELLFMLWLLIMGAKPKPSAHPVPMAAAS